MNKATLGILFGIATGALWGLVFLAPQVLSDFSPIEITFGRFFFFGLISLASIGPVWKAFKPFSLREKLHIFLLAATGFWLYTILLIWSVQNSGGVVTALLIGLLPITIPLAAKKLRGIGGMLWLGLALILAGVIVLQAPDLFSLSSAQSRLSMAGLVTIVVALAMWTWYALKNTTFMENHPGLSKATLVSMMGILSGLSLLVLSLFTGKISNIIQHENFTTFLGWTAVIGLGSTWAAYWMWNQCSSRCAPTISGPLVVTETIFGLIYTFIYQQRWPETHETAAMILFGIGLAIALRAEMKAAS